jgi:hypothetical protein
MGLAPYGIRYSESLSQPTTVKRGGYLGDIGTMNEPMTELSSSFEVNGRSVQYPLVVPTLTVDELQLLRAGGEPTPSIYNKAEQFAMGRLSRGQDPFATTQDLRYPQPQGLNPAPSTDQMQATPRGFISGLFSDVLGRTFDMPALPRTGIPALDLFAPNMNAFNRLSLGDVQKTAERISYGEPLTTGAGMTLRPRDETIGAAMTVAPFAPMAGRLAGRTGQAVGRMAGEEINAAITGQPTRSLLGQLTPKPKQIFIGENAKTWDKAGAEKFLELEKSGADPVDSWKLTGTFRSPDGKLRQEISDVSAIGRYDLVSDQLARELDLTAQLTYGKPYQDLDRATKNKLQKEVNDFQSSLNQNLTHPDLYQAYPELANIESTAEFSNIPRGKLEQTRVSSIGAGNVPVNERIVSQRMTSQAPTEEELKSVLLHEAQHAIQNKENFARGGDYNLKIGNLEKEQMAQKYMDTFWPLEEKKGRKFVDVWDDAMRWVNSPSGGQFERYRNVAGEAESRAVQSRMNMTPEQRLETYPIQSYDVPVDQLIYIDPFGNPLR